MKTPPACPHCGHKLVLPAGDVDCPVLIIGAQPGYKEIIKLSPFVGEAGGVLRHELGQFGYDMYQFRITNLWLHMPNKGEGKGKSKTNPCLDYCAEQAIKEGQGKRYILLLGAETSKFFTGFPVTEISGLWVDSKYFPEANIMATVNPADLLHGIIGEFRLALTRFCKRLEKEGIME